MLKITVPETELFNEATGEIFKVKSQELALEHSLISISKWESKYLRPFLDESNQMTAAETIDYIKFMTCTPNVRPEVYLCLTQKNIDDIVEYIQAPMTATTFYNTAPTKPNHEKVTSELIYYWMLANNVPSEYEKWHIRRLLTLLRICGIKNNPNPKKMSKKDLSARYKQLNAARRAKSGSKG